VAAVGGGTAMQPPPCAIVIGEHDLPLNRRHLLAG
jgi:hypothetical protein